MNDRTTNQTALAQRLVNGLREAQERQQRAKATTSIEARPEAAEPGTSAKVEPHRDYHVFANGADLVAYGMTADDAVPLAGLRALPVGKAMLLVKQAAEQMPCCPLGAVLVDIVDRHRDELMAAGKATIWQRRRNAYLADKRSWEQRASQTGDDWRSLRMTSGQRELIRVTATLEKLALPGDLTRGEAADWLERNGANLQYRKVF